jgi:hypothetical protein
MNKNKTSPSPTMEFYVLDANEIRRNMTVFEDLAHSLRPWFIVGKHVTLDAWIFVNGSTTRLVFEDEYERYLFEID